jgi:hypothetical protein
MGKKGKLDVTVGSIIKQACIDNDMSFNILYYKMSDLISNKKSNNLSKKKFTKTTLKLWIKDLDFPDMEDIYNLSNVLKINPNELFEAKENMQNSMVHKPNKALREIAGKMLVYSAPMVKMLVIFIMIVLAILVSMHLRVGDERHSLEEQSEWNDNWEKNIQPLMNGEGFENTQIYKDWQNSNNLENQIDDN